MAESTVSKLSDDMIRALEIPQLIAEMGRGKVSQEAFAAELVRRNVAARDEGVAAGKKQGAASTQQALRCKVSAKGAVSVYGLQRMPVTMYVGQWERLLAYGETLKKWLEENEPKAHDVEEKDANGKETGRTLTVTMSRK